MRNALGLMLASVVAAIAIAGVWFWTSFAARRRAASPQTIAARPAEPSPASAAKTKDDVEVTPVSLSKPATPPRRSLSQRNPPAPILTRLASADGS